MIIIKTYRQKHTLQCRYEIEKSNRLIRVTRILDDARIAVLKKYGNTVIPYEVYEALPKKTILDEIYDLVGFRCILVVISDTDGDCVIVKRKGCGNE